MYAVTPLWKTCLYTVMTYKSLFDGSCLLKEQVGIVCHAFEVFTRGSILLELEMICFLPITVFFL